MIWLLSLTSSNPCVDQESLTNSFLSCFVVGEAASLSPALGASCLSVVVGQRESLSFTADLNQLPHLTGGSASSAFSAWGSSWEVLSASLGTERAAEASQDYIPRT